MGENLAQKRRIADQFAGVDVLERAVDRREDRKRGFFTVQVVVQFGALEGADERAQVVLVRGQLRDGGIRHVVIIASTAAVAVAPDENEGNGKEAGTERRPGAAKKERGMRSIQVHSSMGARLI